MKTKYSELAGIVKIIYDEEIVPPEYIYASKCSWLRGMLLKGWGPFLVSLITNGLEALSHFLIEATRAHWAPSTCSTPINILDHHYIGRYSQSFHS